MVLTPRPRDHRRHVGTAALAALVLGAGACHAPLSTSVAEKNLRRFDRYRLVEGISVPQVRGPSGCGAQALAAALCCGEPSAAAQEVAEVLPWHDQGATPVELLLEARRRGFEARISRGTWEALEAEVDAGRPSLVMIDAAAEVGLFVRQPLPPVMHWAVVSGVARDGSRIALAARTGRHHVLKRGDFLERWARSDQCMIAVRRPP